MCCETWKPVSGFVGKYEVSNKGKVKRLEYVRCVNGKPTKTVPEHLLTQHIINTGYVAVHLIDENGKRHNKTVHRLVATEFIPNPDNLPIVNHMDEDKTNNCVSNLEWCTQSHNMTWNGVNHTISLKEKGRPSKNRKSVVDLNSGVVYNSMAACCKLTHINWYYVKNMCEGSMYSYKGYRLRYQNR